MNNIYKTNGYCQRCKILCVHNGVCACLCQIIDAPVRIKLLVANNGSVSVNLILLDFTKPEQSNFQCPGQICRLVAHRIWKANQL
jgi:hypothetical protein